MAMRYNHSDQLAGAPIDGNMHHLTHRLFGSALADVELATPTPTLYLLGLSGHPLG